MTAEERVEWLLVHFDPDDGRARETLLGHFREAVEYAFRDPDVWMAQYADHHAAAVREAVAAERERCAALVEEQSRLLTNLFEDLRHEPLCRDLAAAIRRGT